MTPHSPTPWTVDPNSLWRLTDANKAIVYMRKNARHIVHCVNLHDELVAACRGLILALANTHASIEHVDRGTRKYIREQISIGQSVLAKAESETK